MKEFFGITEEKYIFEFGDLSTLITILNVALIIAGWHYAPIFGIINCILWIGFSIKNHLHINGYITQIALIILNFYFLTL